MKRLVIAVGFAIVLGASACSSSTSGSGAPVGLNSTSASATSSSPKPTPSTSPRAATSAPTTAATPTSAATSPSSTPTTGATSPSSTPTTGGPPVAAQILTVNATSACGGKTTGVSNGTINVTWTSAGTDQVWLLPSQVASALVGADAKSSGGKGPYPSNGSIALPNAFSCGDTANYVLVQPYKAGTGSAGIIQFVARA